MKLNKPEKKHQSVLNLTGHQTTYTNPTQHPIPTQHKFTQRASSSTTSRRFNNQLTYGILIGINVTKLMDYFPPRYSQRWCQGWNYEGARENCTNCNLAYTGEDCEIYLLQEDLLYVVCFLIYQFGFFAAYILNFMWSIVGVIAKLKTGRAEWYNIYMFVVYMVIGYCIARFFFLVDPSLIYGVLHPELYSTMGKISLTLLVSASILSTTVFYDLANTDVMRSKFNFGKAKVITIVYTILSVIVTTVITILERIGVPLISVIMDLLVLVNFIIIAIIVFVVVPKLSSFAEFTQSRDLERVSMLLLC